MFRNRLEAGEALARRLATQVPQPCVVAAVPRGGVVVGAPVARALHAPLTVVYARKLTDPGWPELAFGALDEDGECLLNPKTVEAMGLGVEEIEHAKARVRGEIHRRMALFGAPSLGTFLPGRAVVLVDDGLATGLTMRVAVHFARRHGATDVTVATPCASTDAAAAFRGETERVVSLIVDRGFMAVGQYYEEFQQVSDDEVITLLEHARQELGSHEPGRV